MSASETKLALKQLATDWRSNRLQLLVVALILSVTVVAGLSAFVSRLEVMLVGQSSQFLAADRVLSDPYPANPELLQKATELGLQQASHLSFRSMLYKDDEPVLVSVKAASDRYPLKGELTYREGIDSPEITGQQGPELGTVWLEQRLWQQLGLKVGDPVYIGDALLRVNRLLVAEPDRGAGFITMGSRVLMHLDDVPATNVIQPGSRLTYHYLFAGDTNAIRDYEDWLLPQLSDSQRWLDLEKSQPTVATSLERAKRFFLLASSIVVVLASIAIAMASSRYARQHIKQVAVLKTLGMTSQRIQNLYLTMLVFLWLGVTFVGSLLAYGLQEVVIRYATASLDVAMPAISLQSFILGGVCALISLGCFALPPLITLKNIPAVRIFQLDATADIPVVWRSLAVAGIGLVALLIIYTHSPILSLLMLAGLVLLVFIVALPVRFLLGYLLSKGLRAGSFWSLAKANIQRRMTTNVVQVAVFATALMLLVTLIGVRDSLFTQWQNQLPEKTPNHFIVNLQKHELPIFDDWLAQLGLDSEPVAAYPMLRGRLIEVNGTPVTDRVSKEVFQRSGANRELNLSWSSQLPADNAIVEGEWFADGEAVVERVEDAEVIGDVTSAEDTATRAGPILGVSVESQLAERLNIVMGDELSFMVTAELVSARVTSIREVEWDRMHPNFYMMFAPRALDHMAHTYMTSFWVPDDRKTEVNQVMTMIPTSVVIDVAAVIQQIRSIVHHVSQALQLVLVFVMVGALVVMWATVQAGLDLRTKENTIIRALGGKRGLIIGSLLCEFALLGFIAGVVATIMSELILVVLQAFVFKLDFALHPEIWWIAPVMGIVMVGAGGYLSARRVVSTTPMELLREV
ncbi:Uncharacterised protein [BD1-7 clade bacterium]|uniref:ABC3 transporter permease C-terminal domain-containing protein n=1 Tax=BD1-7 clade bacterium TaxID=2029982 RepID=A0A5S9PUY9_9GAMM|nr:Uncharacterised protein [BD1-7 clade bacterium]